jgi:hypothetical protein
LRTRASLGSVESHKAIGDGGNGYSVPVNDAHALRCDRLTPRCPQGDSGNSAHGGGNPCQFQLVGKASWCGVSRGGAHGVNQIELVAISPK